MTKHAAQFDGLPSLPPRPKPGTEEYRAYHRIAQARYMMRHGQAAKDGLDKRRERYEKNATAQIYARDKVRDRVRRGLLQKPSACESCGGEKRLQAHHPDYSRPLSVIWLCSLCHGKQHSGKDRWSVKPDIFKEMQ